MSGTLPDWLERLLGVPQAGTGEGTAWTLDHAWPLPGGWWGVRLLVLFLALLVLGCYFRQRQAPGLAWRTLLAGLRLTALAGLLLMLASLVLALHRTGLPYVVVLLDTSASMGLTDRYESDLEALAAERVALVGLTGATRINLAKSLLLADDARLLEEIARRYKLRLYLVGEASQAQTGTAKELAETVRRAEAVGEASRLGQAVRDVLNDLRGTPPCAVVLLSDGINTEGDTLADAAAYARRKGVPLFTVALGSDAPTRDLELADLLVDEVVFVDDVVNFEFKLTARGLAGRSVRIVLREKNSREVLAELRVKAGPDGQAQRLRLPYKPQEVGDFEYTIEAEPLTEEIQTANNRQTRSVSVRKEQIRVLLVQAYPHYEFRYLKHLLEREPTIRLSTVLQEADLEYAEEDRSALRTFPLKQEDLFEYDVLIFGDVNPALLSSSVLEHVRAFVTQRGGGVVIIAGPRYMPHAYRQTPLEELFPIDLPPAAELLSRADRSFQMLPTEAGLALPPMQLGDTLEETREIWNNLPPLYWLLEVPALKPAARVLAEHPQLTGPDGRRLPLVIMHYVGAGKVIFHATDETWRWRYRVGDVFFARYWMQTIRYLSRTKLLGKDRTAELVTDRREYRRGENVRLRVRFIDDRLAPAEDQGVTVVVERAGDESRRVMLRRSEHSRGVFEGLLVRPADGSYHAWVAVPVLGGTPPSTDFQVAAPPGELERVATDFAEMKRAAVSSKGRAYTLHTAHRLLRDLPPGRQVKTEPLPPLVLWNQWPLLALVLGALVAEWALRKVEGMV
jgi:hypothetical protein